MVMESRVDACDKIRSTAPGALRCVLVGAMAPCQVLAGTGKGGSGASCLTVRTLGTETYRM